MNNETLPSASASGGKTIPLKFIPVDENTQYIVDGEFFLVNTFYLLIDYSGYRQRE